MRKTILLITSLLFCGVSQATLWQVDSVLQGTDEGFGFSSLHAANDSTPMSGAILATIDSASGTYDDATGEVNFAFGLSSNDTLTLSGILNFIGGALAQDSVLNYSGLNNLAASSPIGFPADNNQFGFKKDLNCGGCGGADGPNSFVATGVGDLHYMTLWGADFTNTVFQGNYLGSLIGMDFRLELSPVPVPAAVWLFGTALLGLFGFQRRKAAT